MHWHGLNLWLIYFKWFWVKFSGFYFLSILLRTFFHEQLALILSIVHLPTPLANWNSENSLYLYRTVHIPINHSIISKTYSIHKTTCILWFSGFYDLTHGNCKFMKLEKRKSRNAKTWCLHAVFVSRDFFSNALNEKLKLLNQPGDSYSRGCIGKSLFNKWIFIHWTKKAQRSAAGKFHQMLDKNFKMSTSFPYTTLGQGR